MRKSIFMCAGLALCCRMALAEEPILQRYDHYNPILLNERALQDFRQGDVNSAIVLLDRAVLLAPYDARIRRNLDVLQAWKKGDPIESNDDSDAPNEKRKSLSIYLDVQSLPIQPVWPKK